MEQTWTTFDELNGSWNMRVTLTYRKEVQMEDVPCTSSVVGLLEIV